jgi:hypothetical protein
MTELNKKIELPLPMSYVDENGDDSSLLKQERILEELRQLILSGQLSPGDKLPTRGELMEAYGVSSVTVNAALGKLRRDGFIKGAKRRGTFVTQDPPHLYRFGLLFPGPETDSENPSRSRLWDALIAAAREVDEVDPQRLPVYQGIEPTPDSQGMKRLMEDLDSHRLAGLIFAFHPGQFIGLPLLTDYDVPKVAIANPLFEGVSGVYTDFNSFIDRALDLMVKNGRKRVAWVGLWPPNSELHDYLRDAIEQRGMMHRPEWFQRVARVPGSTRQTVRLLMNENNRIRPDALLITDDNIADEATYGMLEAGVELGRNADAVVHCNYPDVAPKSLPVYRLGFDCRDILRICIDQIQRKREGEVVEGVNLLPALFDDELNGNGGNGDNHGYRAHPPRPS